MKYYDVRWDEAACRGWDYKLFFIENGNHAVRVLPTLRENCSQCPIEDDCREYAISDPSIHGFWGNTTDKEREKIRASRRRKKYRESKKSRS